MTIRRGNFELVCNNCLRTEDLDTTDFDDARDEVKRLEEDEDWTTVKKGSEYRHLCGNCSNGL